MWHCEGQGEQARHNINKAKLCEDQMELLASTFSTRTRFGLKNLEVES